MTSTPPSPSALSSPLASRPGMRRFFGLFGFAREAWRLLWQTDSRLTAALSLFTAGSGALPAMIAYVGKLIIDGVLRASQSQGTGARRYVMLLIGVELVLVAGLAALQRALAVCDALLRVRLAQRVIESIVEKALSLNLADLENAAIYDQLAQVRDQATTRPLSLVRRALLGLQLSVSLIGFLALMGAFSPWLVPLLLLASLPAVFGEVRFNADAFRLFREHSPEARRQSYLETVLTREDHAKEVKLFGLGPVLVERHRAIFRHWYQQDRKLVVKRGAWGFAFTGIASAALAVSYAFVAWRAMAGLITVGTLAMLFAVLRQAQAAVGEVLLVLAGMYDDNLYISMLRAFLALPEAQAGTAMTGLIPGDGLRFENVEFSYPGASTPALSGITLHATPGMCLAVVGRNGAGKTTLAKLATGLYAPTRGRVLLDGRDLREWDPGSLAARFSALFQDFVHYQLEAGENIGAGWAERLQDESAWKRAADLSLASSVIEGLPRGFRTQLGHWFEAGQELSLGEWQKIALGRMFFREQADHLLLDEPTASLDAQSEELVFNSLLRHAKARTTIIISHRLSTLKLADRILVLDEGHQSDVGTHDELLARGGMYAELFRVQAAGYSSSNDERLGD